MARGNLNGLTVLLLRVILFTITLMVMVHINGTIIDSIMENGESIRCMGKEYLLGLMVEDLKVTM
jgi:hypothetical protein